MQNWASSPTHPQVAGQGELEAGADRVALHHRDRDEPRVAQPGEPPLEARRWSRRSRSSVRREQPDHRLRVVGGCRRVEHRPVEPGREALPLAAHDDHPDVVGDLVADRGQGPPHRRRLGVAHLGAVEGDGRDHAATRRSAGRRPRAPRESCGHSRSGAGVDAAGRRRRSLRSSDPAPPGRAVLAHARETRSAYESFQRSSTPSGRISTRSGSSARTAPSSWVTSTIAPW